MAGKVVAGPCMMAMALLFFSRSRRRSRMGEAAGRRSSSGGGYRHEDVSRMAGDAGRLLAQRQERHNRPSRSNPLPRDSAVNKGLSTRPSPTPSGVPVFNLWKPAQPAKLQPFKPEKPEKFVMQKPNVIPVRQSCHRLPTLVLPNTQSTAQLGRDQCSLRNSLRDQLCLC